MHQIFIVIELVELIVGKSSKSAIAKNSCKPQSYAESNPPRTFHKVSDRVGPLRPIGSGAELEIAKQIRVVL